MNRRPTVVLLAAGESSRFWPLSTHGHKSLHRLYGQAIIEHTVGSLASAGFTDVVVVQSPYGPARAGAESPRTDRFPHRTIADQLGDGSRYGVRLRYVDQPEAVGQGDAILRTAALLDGPEFCLVQPESVNAGAVLRELVGAPGNVMAVHECAETWLFGICAVDGELVTDIVEKPAKGREPSRLCNMAVAKLDRDYLTALKDVPVDPISSVLALQELARERKLRYVRTERPFFPLKYPWHLFAIAEHLGPSGGAFVGEGATVNPTAEIADDCVIESDAVIGPGVKLSRSLIGAGSRVRSSIADSILGADVSIESDVTVETTPVTDGHVTVDVKGHEIDTDLRALGTTIGQGAIIRRGSVISAGVLIGAESEVPADGTVAKNLPDRSRGVEPASRK